MTAIEREIYFAAQGGRIKIGIANNAKVRVADIGKHLAPPIELLGVIKGDLSLERDIHETLAPYRLKGEWFEDCPAVRWIIKRVLENPKGTPLKKAPRKDPEPPIVLKAEDGDDWFRKLVKEVHPEKTGMLLHLATGVDERLCQKYAAGSVRPSSSFLRTLLRTENGWNYLSHLMAGSEAPWWVELQSCLSSLSQFVK